MRWMAAFLVLAFSLPAGAQNRCPGKKVYFEGRCRYPEKVEGLKQARKPKKAVTRPASCPKGYVLIRPGAFMMGSPPDEPGRDPNEGPRHRVTISKAFCLKKTEVTQGEWKALMGNNPSYFENCGDSCPVEEVSWWDAVAYCNALSRKEGLPECYSLSDCNGTPGARDFQCSGVTFAGLSCKGYRLPTEAEWEYAARSAGRDRVYPWGDEGATCERAVIDDGGEGCGRNSTWPVCSKAAGNTDHGVCDMAGSLWEWVEDRYHDSYNGAPSDGSAWESPGGSGQVVRGGTWRGGAEHVRVARRGRYVDPGFRYDDVGFRIGRSVP